MIRTHFREPSDSRAEPNRQTKQDRPDRARISPSDWLSSVAEKLAPGKHEAAFVLLTGGADLVGFRLRVAQSHTRSDMLPSCFDHAALVLRSAAGAFAAYHVPIRELSINFIAARNGIHLEKDLTALAPDWERTPNLGLLRFPKAEPKTLRRTAEELVRSRASDDFVTPLAEWLRFIWGTEGADNPVLRPVSVPSAAFVESCYASAGQDITPSAAIRIATPESIWQARFWPEYSPPKPEKKTEKKPTTKTDGFAYYVLHQPAACVSWPTEEHTNAQFLGREKS